MPRGTKITVFNSLGDGETRNRECFAFSRGDRFPEAESDDQEQEEAEDEIEEAAEAAQAKMEKKKKPKHKQEMKYKEQQHIQKKKKKKKKKGHGDSSRNISESIFCLREDAVEEEDGEISAVN